MVGVMLLHSRLDPLLRHLGLRGDARAVPDAPPAATLILGDGGFHLRQARCARRGERLRARVSRPRPPPPSLNPSQVLPALVHSSGVASAHRSAHSRFASAVPSPRNTPWLTYVSRRASLIHFFCSSSIGALRAAARLVVGVQPGRETLVHVGVVLHGALVESDEPVAHEQLVVTERAVADEDLLVFFTRVGERRRARSGGKLNSGALVGRLAWLNASIRGMSTYASFAPPSSPGSGSLSNTTSASMANTASHRPLLRLRRQERREGGAGGESPREQVLLRPRVVGDHARSTHAPHHVQRPHQALLRHRGVL